MSIGQECPQIFTLDGIDIWPKLGPWRWIFGCQNTRVFKFTGVQVILERMTALALLFFKLHATQN